MRLTNNLVNSAVIMLILATALTGQSTSPSSPTPVNGQYKGKGPTSETDYYFSFTGGPGSVSVTLDIKAKGYSTFARIEIGNNPSNLIAMHNMNASTTTGPASVTKEFILDKQQTVRIKLTLDHNLAEYTLSVNGGSSTFSSGGGGDSRKTGTVGKIGKQSAGSTAKIGSLGPTGGKPTPDTQSSDGGGEEKLSFACPAEIVYKIVPPGDWNPGLFGQMRFLFQQASVSSPILSCTYTSLTGQESVTIMQKIPAGYVCEVWKGGPKTRDIVCTLGPTAIAPPPAESFSRLGAGGSS